MYELSGDYTENHEQIIEDLYANEYPKDDEAYLQSIDDFIASIKFKNKQ